MYITLYVRAAHFEHQLPLQLLSQLALLCAQKPVVAQLPLLQLPP